jgi:hypothetical protein
MSTGGEWLVSQIATIEMETPAAANEVLEAYHGPSLHDLFGRRFLQQHFEACNLLYKGGFQE